MPIKDTEKRKQYNRVYYNNNKTTHYYKGQKIICKSIYDYMGKNEEDFTNDDYKIWSNYLSSFYKKPTNYNDTTIYCIEVNNEMYVGHTTNFQRRMKEHEYTSKNFIYQKKLYTAIDNAGGWDNVNVSVLKNCKCRNRHQAVLLEQEAYDTLNPSLNTNLPLCE